jgi:ADP-ribosylglycohydrolase
VAWASPLELLREELIQRRDEGCVIPDELAAAIEEVGEEDAWRREKLEPLYRRLQELPEDEDLRAREPTELAEIRRLRPDGPRRLHWNPGERELVDRFHGAWLGRLSGCALGKPVEAIGLSGGRDDPGRGRRRIRELLEERGEWPLRDYFAGGDGLIAPASQRESIAYMEPDDDIHYTLCGLAITEANGASFGWRDVASWWLRHIPVGMICTAEACAVQNVVEQTALWSSGIRVTAEFTRRHWNPWREWIGAQIRSDGWAWACAGHPELAAELAWRDAHWTHERNGVYGAMFFAAMQAAAFAIPDPRRLVEIGLSEIPAQCRLARWVRACAGWAAEDRDWEQTVGRIEAELPSMHAVHTINNALVCVAALLHEGLDPVAATGAAVSAGLDTDCNGATVGSVVGAAVGRADLDMTLAGRLNDTVRPHLAGMSQVSAGELARRTAAAWRRVREAV